LMENSTKSTEHNASTNNQKDGSSVLTSKSNADLIDQILDYIARSTELINR
jgi:nuclear pore complex protein Nup188